MDLTNILYAFLLGFVMIGGFMVIFSSMSADYPSMTANSTYLANVSAQMDATAQIMDTQVINATTTQALNTQNLNVAAIFGYVTGAINALGTLIIAPYIFLQLVNGLASSVGFPLVPNFILQAVTVAVYLMALVGVLYYLLKVK